MKTVNKHMKSQIATKLTAALTAVLLMSAAQGDNDSALCAKAADPASYNNAFLKNFVTLKEGNDNWLFRDIDLKQQFMPKQSSLKKLAQLNRLLKQRGTKLILVPTPTRALTHPEKLGDIDFDARAARRSYKAFIKTINKLGIASPKLYRLFEQPHSKPLFFARDHHWTSHGAEQVAQLTAAPVKASKKYQGIENISFINHGADKARNNGSLKKAAKRLCNTSYPAETFNTYITERATEIDLFADTAAPQVVLVGTSNSQGALNFNFSGFLQQHAGVDVLNKAQSGGGQDQALYDYLTSTEYRDNPPRFLIWELPSYYSFNNHRNLDRVIELLHSLPKNAIYQQAALSNQGEK